MKAFSSSVIFLCAVAGLFGAGCSTSTRAKPSVTLPATTNTQMIGGDRDVHGCIGSAGYQWCEASRACQRLWENPCLSPGLASATTTVLISTQNPDIFCNGAEMDSAGYRNTITSVKSVVLPTTDRTDDERIISLLRAASGERCQTLLDQLTFTKNEDSITFDPVNGWAGVSITLCHCKPLIEKNVLRIPGISRVEWK